ncbi:unnamed protein product [Linum tenue]|uniref:Autophagy-related protein 27 n=1 Tax=Linum tenue TaxID=586396 RepID=A0AAV0K2Y0_9ROSI|nr:unnamed protein product [Linum tenue]
MGIRIDSLRCSLIAIPLLILASSFHSASAGPCEVSYFNGRQIFNFSLTAPIAGFPHGVLSEDGYYKVAENESVLWFQLCDGMIFNHNPPRCVGCQDCGGPSHCGSGCSALVANNIGGYDVCSTIGGVSSTSADIMGLLSTHIYIADEQNPQKGVIVKISSLDTKENCSLSVSVICNSSGLTGPLGLQKSGTCDYAAVLQHPSGCATVVSVHGKGLGWFATLIIIVLCVFGAYMLAGAVYRHFFLGIHGFDVMPNLDFWITLPQRTQGFFASLVRRFRGPTESYRDSYSPVNF